MNTLIEGKETIKYMGKWFFFSLCVGIPMGGLSAFFLWGLKEVTGTRQHYPWLLLGLPLLGGLVSYLYHYYGKNAQRGNNLVIEQANGNQEKIPLRLIPLTLFGTLGTHLFGGSVGREGTAVQMGGSVADFWSRTFKLQESNREVLIASGMAAGFASVFGTPLAGTIFALEVLMVGKIRTEALFPAFFASIIADFTAKSLGATHTHYLMGKAPAFSLLFFLQLIVAGICFGLAGRVFAKSIQRIKAFYQKQINNPILRNIVGGIVVVLLVVVLNGWRYTGLSTELLADAFSEKSHVFDFLGKLFYTVFSLGAGYQGGEVTPLFEIGATLGADLGHLFALETTFFAGLGFIGVFTGATNTPIACFVMGIELFGGENAFYFFFVCVIAALISGHSSIYASQFFPKEKFQHQKTELKKASRN